MYLQALAICCLAIAHSSLCYDDVNNAMNTNRIEMVFQTSPGSDPHREFIAYKEFPRDRAVDSTGRLIVRDGEHIWVQGFASDIHLWLHPRDSFLMLENTPVYHATPTPGEPGYVTFTEQKGAMRRIGDLYAVYNHWNSLVIGTDASGRTRVNGHFATHGLNIRSLPDEVAKEYLRTRRSTSESEHNLSNVTYVVADETPRDLGKEISFKPFNRTNLREREDRSAEENVPIILHPQILCFVDNSLYRKLGSDTQKTLEYLLAFWNGVDLKYRNLERPRIRLSISAIVIETESGGAPYIQNSIDAYNVFDAGRAMHDARFFFHKVTGLFPLESYDIVTTLTARKFEGRHAGAVGLAFTGFACTRSDNTVEGITMVNDDGEFFGIEAAAHELGHSIGMEHDDGKVVDCISAEGYIMATTVQYSLQSSSFSRCSIKTFEELLHDNQLTCLYNQPENSDYHLPKIMPGKMKTLRELCLGHGYNNHCILPSADYCHMVTCSITTACVETAIPVPEGMPCGTLDNMFCLRRRCTQIPQPSDEARQTMFSTAHWFNRGKNPNGLY